jgi:hypothetical protein
MKLPLHIRVAALYASRKESRRLSGPIRDAARTLAANISTWLEKEGPDVAFLLENYPKQLREIVPRPTLERIADRMKDVGIPVEAVDLGWLRFTITFTASSFFDPRSKTIAISKPYALRSGWGDWLSRGGEFERTFLHEFIHAIDFLRGDPQAYGKEIKDDPDQYFTHDLEINARIQELMATFDRELERNMSPLVFQDAMDPDDLEWELYTYLGHTTRHEVQDLLLKLDPRLYQRMDADLRKRILKRLYTEVEEAKERWRNLMEFRP